MGAVQLSGLIGACGGRPAFIGFAPATMLHRLSFADVLQEDTRRGYQRRFSEQHSLEFRRYIQTPGATTIPLTFNLRPPDAGRWRLVCDGRAAMLFVHDDSAKVLSQVDCQHRLSCIGDQEIELPFMTYIGLTEREEMEIFNRINSRAKGLSSSLLDFHQTQMADDLATTHPHLFIALHLNDSPSSPWFRSLDLGGNATVGLSRRASLRTMQKAVQRFLREARGISAQEAARIVESFWIALSKVLPDQWRDSGRHVLVKGVGVYALMSVAGDMTRHAKERGLRCDINYFMACLDDFVHTIDWSNDGALKGFGGGGGADEATELLRDTRKKTNLRMVGQRA